MLSAVFGELDRIVWRFFIHHPFLESFAKTYTKWGVSSILIPMALIIGVALFAWRRSIALSVIPMLALQVNDVATAFLKSFFSVARPPRAEWLAGAAGGSFPSGHMANTTALVLGTALVIASQLQSTRFRCWVFGASSILVSVMGWTRLALHVHWLSDVLAGWVLGSLCASTAAWAVMKLAHFAPTRSSRDL